MNHGPLLKRKLRNYWYLRREGRVLNGHWNARGGSVDDTAALAGALGDPNDVSGCGRRSRCFTRCP